MPLLNFQQQFVPFVEDESKLHTIRAKRKRPWKVGDKLYLYTGLRHRGARLIRQAACVKVEDIDMHWSSLAEVPLGTLGKTLGFRRLVVRIDDEELSHDECESLARRDGFVDWVSFVAYWFPRIPFSGDIIHWGRSEVKESGC